MAASFALARTPMYDRNGNMARQWVLYFAALSTSAGAANSGTPVSITVDANSVATPDLSKGTLFVLGLTADTTLAVPANVPQDGSVIPWTLLIQEDNVGGHSLLTPDYHMSYALNSPQSPANTECVQSFASDVTGTRVTAAPSIDQPIP